jgi:hypothetical protein
MQLQTSKSISYSNKNAKEVWLNGSKLWSNLVVNGDFSNVSGMTSNVTNWWGRAVPFGWNTNATAPATNDFVVLRSTAFVDAYFANLNILSRSAEQAGGLVPFFQNLVMPATSNITLTFFGSNPFNANFWALGCSIVNQTTSTTLANTSITTPQTVTLSASNVPAGNTIRINFWKGAAGHSPGITNVFVTLN